MSSKKIGIFGLGVTGQSIFQEFNSEPIDIICWDDSKQNREIFKNTFPESSILSIEENDWTKLDVIFLSPGIPKSHKIFFIANKFNIKISSDIELFLEKNQNSKVIAITGTNGKSTTAALIGHILSQSGLDYHIGGNIGVPVLSLPQNREGYILELSSFQLDLLDGCSLNLYISVLLNISPDHLDRYDSFSEYSASKESILTEDSLKIIGTSCKISKDIYEKLQKSGEKNLLPLNSKNGIEISEKTLHDHFFEDKSYLLDKNKSLIGDHNTENISASFAVSRVLGLKGKEIIDHLSSFPGLKHRMQYLGKVGNISFYNDSKATNSSAASKAISSLNNIFWLVGGIFKEDNLSLTEKSLQNVRKAYIFGESKLLFKKYFDKKIEYVICDTMQDAFNYAIKDAESFSNNSNLLLAPASASFDQFKNFEERGDQFIELYQKYART